MAHTPHSWIGTHRHPAHFYTLFCALKTPIKAALWEQQPSTVGSGLGLGDPTFDATALGGYGYHWIRALVRLPALCSTGGVPVKTFPRTWALLRFSFGSTRLIWLYLGILGLFCITHVFDLNDVRGLGRALSFSVVMLYIFIIGTLFLGLGKKEGARLPHAEFLLSRPVMRRQIQQYYAVFYFLLVLAPLLISLGVSLFNPDLYLSLHKNVAGPTEALDKLAYYQAQFPQSEVLDDESGNPKELMIPDGSVLVVTWMFVSATLVALEVIIMFQSRPGWWRRLGIGPVTFAVLLCTFLAPFPRTNGIPEKIFFFFSHHWEWFALGTVALAVFVFRTVGKHAPDIEV
jgi:hypothetical protein